MRTTAWRLQKKIFGRSHHFIFCRWSLTSDNGLATANLLARSRWQGAFESTSAMGFESLSLALWGAHLLHSLGRRLGRSDCGRGRVATGKLPSNELTTGWAGLAKTPPIRPQGSHARIISGERLAAPPFLYFVISFARMPPGIRGYRIHRRSRLISKKTHPDTFGPARGFGFIIAENSAKW